MTPNQIAAKARKMIAGKPELEADMRQRWERVSAAINERAAMSTGLHVHYRRQDSLRKARLAMLTKFVNGGTPEAAGRAAFKAVGMTVEPKP